MEEIWKDIDGYEGFYQVSNLGRVRRLTKSRGKHILKGAVKRNGYVQVVLSEKYVIRYVSIHTLVANAFLIKEPHHQCVNHKNCIKSDNRLVNLEWCTQSDNVKHANKNNLRNPVRGCSHPLCKLSEDKVLLIRQMHNNGISISELAKKFKVSYASIYLIIKRINWHHI